MLSPADQAICERDPALPGLPFILDAAEFARVLGLPDLVLSYLRYKPGTSCTAAFVDPERGPMAAYAYTPERYAEVRRREEWRADTDVVMLDEACIAVIPARLDRKLKALRRFGDDAHRAKVLRRLIGRGSGISEGDFDILRYKPGRRLVVRLDVKGRPRAALKVIGAADYNQALIGAVGAAAQGGARLLGCDAGRGVLVTSWIAGDPLCPAATGRAPARTMVAETGAALAKLHAATFRPAAKVTRADELDALGDVEPAMSALHADLGREAGRLAGMIASRLETSDYATTLIHGDFSADQVVHSGKRPIILDWDRAARGDPASDFGTFLARLDAQVADGVLTPDDAEAINMALVDGYGAAAGRLPEGIALQHARSLLMLATEGFRIRHPNWPERTGVLLERAAGLLAQRRRPHLDPAIPTLDDALDGEKARAEIAAAIGHLACDVRIEKPKLVRHKRGRRAIVRYDVATADGARHAYLGKLQAKKRCDHRTPAVHEALRAAGLDGTGQTDVGVPRTAGVIAPLGLWLQEVVPGTCLGDVMGPDTDPAPFLRTGEALAELHRRGSKDARRWTMADEHAVLERALRRAADARPDLACALRDLSHRAAETLSAIGEAPVCAIHRDFYFDQVIVDEARIWIVDLDLYACGDPAIDVGNFVAHLDELGLRHHTDPMAFDRHKAAFLNGYASASGPADSARAAVLKSISLARHIALSLQLPGRSHTTDQILELSAAALAPVQR
jgi:aminoglycoside phosphotransferase (APT) family kinase protein